MPPPNRRLEIGFFTRSVVVEPSANSACSGRGHVYWCSCLASRTQPGYAELLGSTAKLSFHLYIGGVVWAASRFPGSDDGQLYTIQDHVAMAED